MKPTSLFLAIALTGSAAFAADDPVIFQPKKATRITNVDSTKANSVQFDVSIFGEGAVGSIYVLWDEVDLSDEMKKLLSTRDFRNDEFFMQNIDREQFEQERMLQLFEDKKREYFLIFPSEIEKEKEDRDNE